MNGAQRTPSSHMLTLLLLSLLFFLALLALISVCSFHNWFSFACNFYEWFHWNGLCLRLFSKRFVSEIFCIKEVDGTPLSLARRKGKRKSSLNIDAYMSFCWNWKASLWNRCTFIRSGAVEKCKFFQLQGATENTMMKWFYFNRRSFFVCLFRSNIVCDSRWLASDSKYSFANKMKN